MKTSANPLIFIVDDDPFILQMIKSDLLQQKFSRIETFLSGEECLQQMNLSPDIVILDYMLDGRDGIEVLKKIKVINPNTEVIFMSAQKKLKVAVNSIKLGATEYIDKNDQGVGKVQNAIKMVMRKKSKTSIDKTSTQYSNIILAGIVAFIIGVIVVYMQFPTLFE